MLGLLLLDKGKSLLLMSVRLGELEGNLVGGESSVGVGHSLEAGLHHVSVKGVEEDSLNTVAINVHSDRSASDDGGGNDVSEESGVDSSESPGAGSLLGSVMLG